MLSKRGQNWAQTQCVKIAFMSWEHYRFDLSFQASQEVQQKMINPLTYPEERLNQFSISKDHRYLFYPIKTSLQEAWKLDTQAYFFHSLGAALTYDLIATQLKIAGIVIDASTPGSRIKQAEEDRRSRQNPHWLKDYLQESSPNLWGFLDSVSSQFSNSDQKECFWKEALKVIASFYPKIQPPGLDPLSYTPKRLPGY